LETNTGRVGVTVVLQVCDGLGWYEGVTDVAGIVRRAG
jgi:hypothetical protein